MPKKRQGSYRSQDSSSPPVMAEPDTDILLSADHLDLKMCAGRIKVSADKMHKLVPDINRKRQKATSKHLSRLEDKYAEHKNDIQRATNELKALQSTSSERFSRLPLAAGSMRETRTNKNRQTWSTTPAGDAEAGFSSLDTPEKSDCLECRMWKGKHDKLQKELDREKATISSLERDCDEMKRSKNELIKKLSATETNLKDVLASYVPKGEMLSWKEKYQSEYDERENAMMRLSEMASSQLRDNNPNIADLSDVNRPTKLGEKMSELYDNAWTNAFDEFENIGMEEDDIIKCLLDVLMDIYKECKKRSDGSNYFQTVQRCIEQSEPGGKLDGSMNPQLRQQIKEFRKARAPKVIPNIQESIIRSVHNVSKQPYATKAVREYMEECVELCWFMVVQDPPVVLKSDMGPVFDTKAFKEYTKRGKYVEFVCWPVTYLHEDGPMLCKGVAQGCTEIPGRARSPMQVAAKCRKDGRAKSPLQGEAGRSNRTEAHCGNYRQGESSPLRSSSGSSRSSKSHKSEHQVGRGAQSQEQVQVTQI